MKVTVFKCAHLLWVPSTSRSGGFSQMLSRHGTGGICRNSSKHEGLELGSQSRAIYNKQKHWKVKPEFCLGPFEKFVFDSGICTDLLVSATL